MEPGKHSITALAAAICRAHHYARHQPPVFEDPYAQLLIRDDEREAIESLYIERLSELDPTSPALGKSRAALVDHVMSTLVRATIFARARFVEDVLFEMIGRGVSQYVLVGAGMDTFAFRRPDLQHKIQVFEIDHPATQQFKLKRLTDVGLTIPPHLHFAAADLEHDDLVAALAQVPYDPRAPAFFAWPGVSVYLTREAITRTLRAIANAAAPGDELVFDYFEADAFLPGRPVSKTIRQVIMHSRHLGEPMVSGFDPRTLGEELLRERFQLIDDLSPSDVNSRFFMGRIDGLQATEHMHLARASVV